MKNGQVVAFGTPEEVITEESLTPIFDTPIEVIEGPHGRLACYH